MIVTDLTQNWLKFNIIISDSHLHIYSDVCKINTALEKRENPIGQPLSTVVIILMGQA